MQLPPSDSRPLIALICYQLLPLITIAQYPKVGNKIQTDTFITDCFISRRALIYDNKYQPGPMVQK
jgi:hypothetical protein